MSQNYFYPSDAANANPSVGSNGQPAPASSTEIGGIDPGGDLIPVAVDSSGKIEVNINSASPIDVDVIASVLPTGAATEAKQDAGNTILSNIQASTDSIDVKTPVLGQAAMAASVPVVIASNQSAVSVTGPLTDAELRATPVPVSLTSTTITGTVAATQSGTWNVGLNAGSNVIGHVITDATSTTAVTQATAANLNATVVGTGTFATQAAQSGTWTVQPGNTANTTAWLVQDEKSSTATLANISGATSSTTLQASNSARKGWMCYNDSTSILYVKFGSTASSTSFTVLMQPGAYYELPTTSVYTGIITGIWVSATGAARVTELT